MFFLNQCCGAKEAENKNRTVSVLVTKEGEVTTTKLETKEEAFANDNAQDSKKVVVRVHFVAITPSDKEKLGAKGHSFSGKVKWVGKDVTAIRVDDHVFGYTNEGQSALQDWVKVDAPQVFRSESIHREAGAAGPWLVTYANHAAANLKKDAVTYVSGNGAFTSTVKTFGDAKEATKGAKISNPVADAQAEWFYDGGNFTGVKDHKYKATNTVKPGCDNALSTNWTNFVTSYKDDANKKLWDTITASTVETQESLKTALKSFCEGKCDLYIVDARVLNDIPAWKEPVKVTAPLTEAEKKAAADKVEAEKKAAADKLEADKKTSKKGSN